MTKEDEGAREADEQQSVRLTERSSFGEFEKDGEDEQRSARERERRSMRKKKSKKKEKAPKEKERTGEKGRRKENKITKSREREDYLKIEPRYLVGQTE